MQQIPVTCDPAGYLPRVERTTLETFQRDLKDLREDEYRQLRDSILRYGFLAPIFVWRGKILDGHQRLRVIEQEGWTIEGGIPIVEIQADSEADAAERLLVISSQYGRINEQGLYEFGQHYGLDLAAFDLAHLPEVDWDRFREGYFGTPEPDNGDSAPEAPDPADAVTKPGDLWRLGDHRLVCGDATDPLVVEKLFCGEVPEMMVTDPPYGVDYDPTWRTGLLNAKPSNKMGKVTGDDRADWRDAWALFPGDVVYVWFASTHIAEVQTSLINCGFDPVSLIIWNKDRFALSRGDYHWKHEPCWYMVRKGANHRWAGARDQSTVWDIPARDDEGHGHGTQKPVECMARPIRNHEATLIYDPFVGSGTTIIACERLERRCLALEIDPVYCDVVLKRFEDETGISPERDDGQTYVDLLKDRAWGKDLCEQADRTKNRNGPHG
jgi:DNA modification methylase